MYVKEKLIKEGKIVGLTLVNSGTEYKIPKERFKELVGVNIDNASISKDSRIISKGGCTIPEFEIDGVRKITLYHGSDRVVEKPEYGYGSWANDFGRGFYCTLDLELAKEWACKTGSAGYVSRYDLPVDGLSVYNVKRETYEDILRWITILMSNRRFNVSEKGVVKRNFRYLEDNFLDKSYLGYDLVYGWRADDSYFRYAKNFVYGFISLEFVSRAVLYGNLGNQLVLKSRKAFDRVKYTGSIRVGSKYISMYADRDSKARRLYDSEDDIGGIYIQNIVGGKVNLGGSVK